MNSFLFQIISLSGVFCLFYYLNQHLFQRSTVKFNARLFIPILKIFDYLFHEPVMSAKEKTLFYKYLDLSYVYFEFGSGGSTYQAAKRNLKIYSVESDAAWHNKMKEDIANITNQINKAYTKQNIKNAFNPDITYLTIDLHVPFNGWGWPGKDTKYDDWIKYTRAYNHSKYRANLILIDGRFRVACGLNVFKEIDNNVFVYVHDFNDREYYHILLNYFNIVDSADRSVVLRKKESPPFLRDDLVFKYENIQSLTFL